MTITDTDIVAQLGDVLKHVGKSPRRLNCSYRERIRYPVARDRYYDFDPDNPELPDTVETRYARWYCMFIGSFFDVRSLHDTLIALLAHYRGNPDDYYAIQDYLTETGVL